MSYAVSPALGMVGDTAEQSARLDLKRLWSIFEGYAISHIDKV